MFVGRTNAFLVGRMCIWFGGSVALSVSLASLGRRGIDSLLAMRPVIPCLVIVMG